MLSHSHILTMPHTFSSRTFSSHTFSSSVKRTVNHTSINHTSVAMSSHATASQVHVNGSAVPAAASRFVHANGSVVPATASRPAHVDDISQMLSNMSIDNTSASSSRTYASKSPLAITTATSASKDCPPLRQHHSLATSSVNSASILERIAERRRRVIANTTPSINHASVHDRIAERRRRRLNANNLAADDQRPKPSVKLTPTSTHKSSSTSSRVRPALTAQLLTSLSTTTVPNTPVDSSLIANDGSLIGDESSDTTASVTSIDLTAAISELTYVAVGYPHTNLAVATPESPVAVIPEPELAYVRELTMPANPAIELVASQFQPAPTIHRPRRYGYVFYRAFGCYRQVTEKQWTRKRITQHVEISDRVSNIGTRIPSRATSLVPRRQLPGRFRPATYPLTRTPIPGQLSPVFLPYNCFPDFLSPIEQTYFTLVPKKGKARGDQPYCHARPGFDAPRGAFGYASLHKGRMCRCPGHDHSVPEVYRTEPQEWWTTPAESGTDPYPRHRVVNKSPRTVRFADVVQVFDSTKPRAACLPQEPKTSDPSTRAKDFPEGFPLYN